MAKKNILVQTGTRTEQRISADGKTYEVEVPILEVQTVDMSEEEVAALGTPTYTDPTSARLDEIETALVELAAIVGGE